MAKKQSLIVHPDGSQSDGMFSWGGKPKRIKYDPAKLLEWTADWHKSSADRLAELREWLTVNVTPYLVGPISTEEAMQPGRPGNRRHIHLSTGVGCYIVSPDAPPAISNALDALDEIRSLEHVLAHGNDPDLLVRFAINLGALAERFQLRLLFAPSVMSAEKSRMGRATGGANTAKLSLAERAKVIKERDRRAKKERRPKSEVAKVIRTELLTGTFPGIDRKVSNPPGVDRIRTMR